MNKTVSVWLILEDGKNKGKIALQKRSLKDQTHHFLCQATWAGKVEPFEDLNTAIIRECNEELGKNLCENIDFSKLKLSYTENFEVGNENWESYNYLGKASEELLKTAKMHEEAHPEFIFISKGDKFYPVKSGNNPENTIVLFNDQYKVLDKILNEN